VNYGSTPPLLARATQVQLRSRGRTEVNHLPDGPEQRARDARFAGQDPLRHDAWLYGHYAEKTTLARQRGE
jgi:salicylate hydroxylase